MQLIKCKGGEEAGCASDEEIIKFMRNKFILLYYNQIRFNSFLYGKEAITPEAQLNWLSVNTQMQTLIPFNVFTTELLLQDELVNLDDLTELKDQTVFRLKQLPTKSFEKNYDVQMDITIEMNLNQLVVARDGYTALDLLSDIGGMESMLITGFLYLLSIWNYHYLENYLVARLYRVHNSMFTDEEIKAGKNGLVLKPFPVRNLTDFFCEMLPARW